MTFSATGSVSRLALFDWFHGGDLDMRSVSLAIAVAALVCMGASTAPAAVASVKPEVRLADDGAWQVVVS